MGWGVTGVSLMVISGLGRMAEGFITQAQGIPAYLGRPDLRGGSLAHRSRAAGKRDPQRTAASRRG
jgi:hypothetical protein